MNEREGRTEREEKDYRREGRQWYGARREAALSGAAKVVLAVVLCENQNNC